MINNVSGEGVGKILLVRYEGNACMWGWRKVQKERNSFSIRGKTGTQSQKHALGLSLKMFTDTHNDDEYVDSRNYIS